MNVDAETVTAITQGLRRAGARFALLQGSRTREPARANLEGDIDVAAWGGQDPPPPWEVPLPTGSTS